MLSFFSGFQIFKTGFLQAITGSGIMKNTTLTLLATTILSAAAIQANAAPLKEPEAQFYPAKSWIVGNGATPADCVVQSEFNNGFVLRFEGAKDWVESFSINFRQNIFMAGNTYNVTLSVPGKTSKQFSAAATDMTTLSLHADKDIYQLARDNSVLDVVIDDNSFRFFLVNFAAAAGKFETCMAGGDIGGGTAAPAIAAEPQPVSAPEILEPAPAPAFAEPQHVSAPEPLKAPDVPQRDVSNSIPQGAMAPPPPNARDVDAIASLNESIALEERETSGKNVPVTEILPEDPKPTMQKIPYTETVKIADPIIVKDSKEASPPPAASPAPYRKRMSEQLAQEMATNPSTASILEGGNSQAVESAPVETAKAEPLAPIDRAEPMAVPPTIEETVTPPPAAQAAAQEEPEEAPPQIIAWSSPPPSPPSASLKPASVPAPAPAAPAPIAAAPVKISSKITPEQARAMAAAQMAGQPLGLVQTTAQPAASLKPIASAPEKLQPIKQSELAPLPSLQPAASPDEPFPESSDEPFSEPGIVIKTDKLKSADKNAMPDPIIPPPPGLDEPAFDKPAPASNVQRLQTPEMKVHKQTYQAEADFRDAEEFPPVLQNGEPKVRRKADPEMLMKISQLEKKINELEKENSAIQSNVSSSKQEAVSIETDNWNLERATARYNEAERQIKRLGEQLQRERALRATEKKDLEAQLFDPQITDQQQQARLAELEQKLDEAEGRLEQQRIRYEERLRSTQQSGARPPATAQ
jgi:hypothetical protein